MGWNPFKDVSNFVSDAFHSMEKIPGSPEAVSSSVNKGLHGDLSWNPYSQDRSVWDYGAGGSSRSQHAGDRRVGRAIGSWYLGNALGGWLGGGGGSGAGEASNFGGEGATFGNQVGEGVSYGNDVGNTGTVAGNSSGYLSEGGGGLNFGDAGLLGGGLGDFSGMGSGFGGGASMGGSAVSEGGSYYDQMLKYLKSKTGGISGKTMGRMAAGGYGLYRANQARQAYKMPSAAEAQSQPGYKAGMDAVQASMAQQGYTGGSNAAAAIGKYGGDFYNNYVNQRFQAAQLQSSNTVNELGSLALLFGGS